MIVCLLGLIVLFVCFVLWLDWLCVGLRVTFRNDGVCCVAVWVLDSICLVLDLCGFGIVVLCVELLVWITGCDCWVDCLFIVLDVCGVFILLCYLDWLLWLV